MKSCGGNRMLMSAKNTYEELWREKILTSAKNTYEDLWRKQNVDVSKEHI
jgi:hypothetical protein